MKQVSIEDLTKEGLLTLLKSAWESGAACGDPEYLQEAKEAQDNWFKRLGLIDE